MGNICGCVRGPKEECYVDPKKAPLKPDSRELKGRRYFQRKKRKQDLQPGESFRIPQREILTSTAINDEKEEPQDSQNGNTKETQEKLEIQPQVETHLSRQESISRGVYVGEVPVLIIKDPCNPSYSRRLAYRLARTSTEQIDRSRSTVDGKLRSVNTTSRGASAKDGLLVKKLLQRQLRRAVSFGAVEHMLRPMRANDRRGSEETFAKIIWGSQANRRRRRRTITCSGYVEHLPAPAKCISSQHEVNVEHVMNTQHWCDSWQINKEIC